MFAQEAFSIAEELPNSCTKVVGVIMEDPITDSEDVRGGIKDLHDYLAEKDLNKFGRELLF